MLWLFLCHAYFCVIAIFVSLLFSCYYHFPVCCSDNFPCSIHHSSYYLKNAYISR
ncbi:hypothetical protein DDI_4190 [Dickeya dianthicola RNS04.9]|nr:hypothetical protein DDI_4190 [Dickeya dianthicola RNS04.9]